MARYVKSSISDLSLNLFVKMIWKVSFFQIFAKGSYEKACFVWIVNTTLRINKFGLCWKHFKMEKNGFYFTLKALFVLKEFKFLSWLFGHVEKNILIRKRRLISKFVTPQPG